jgi:glycosyltransferase involved in cell wall biosynthesis
VLAVENMADARWAEAGVALATDRIVLMPGAGVDVAHFTPAPEPPTPPIVVGIASRLIWSKGIDLAVNAMTALREAGLDIELRIAGASDPENPEHVSEAEIARWRATPGVKLVGRTTDINSFWAETHIACLPTRGGEGLPRSLLEAAACGRPIVTTNVPGCSDFVTPEIGEPVAPNDCSALAVALKALATDGDLRRRRGAGARTQTVRSYSVQAAADAASRAWVRAGLL